ncbi:microcin-processing peptidase 1. Unknown type peptidase. MEROPS family U62 [Methylophilus rhizosphaerae]|uniref:PmbA protein n=1 Tax=Methylophilus rhizosphaerae TaxID=492660 RepID=A0A1G8ZWS1_9PROT|nr:metalloprotease PmbA [Methylophilus rhizosphaerae]SDK19589.1 microcin-processing peptidase 1. Unknown type peptidase. MEROPS family U62 [Methylophilus rhizosphaerae]
MHLEQLKQIAQDIIQLASQAGASSAETEVSFGTGQNVSVRQGETENIEYNRDKGCSVTVYFGQRKGYASTSDLSLQALKDTVEAACNIAKYTAQDPFCGLADAERMATEFPDLSLHHPWHIEVDAALELAKRCEAAALSTDARISNSEGASIYSQSGAFAYANSHGFIGGYPSSRHSISCSVIAEAGNQMQRDYWYSSARDAQDLASPEQVGHIAGSRTAKRLGARPIKTGQYPVLFEAPLASGLIGTLISAISGGNLYRKSSFLLDSLGQVVASPVLHIEEDPFVLKGAASSAFDSEGVACQSRTLVENGVLQGYLLGSYSARKLGMQSTGNAGGAHNILVRSSGQSLEQLLQTLDTGLLITELLGHGMNMVTGDYSRGAAGYWVEKGVIVHPVEEITIASNMKDMLKGITAIGNDRIPHSSRLTGSILVDRMTVASAG